MSPVFTRAGWQSLRASWLLLGVCVAAAVAIVLASQWLLERERRESVSSARRLQEARARVESASRERDSLRESADVFRTLVERGLLQPERRLELVELVNDLRAKHQLFGLDYEIGAQRPLALAGGRTFTSVDVMGSRVRLRARALHEGDALGFIEALARTSQGFYPVDRCTFRRLAAPEGSVLQPRVEADCTMEWITLKEKRVSRPN